MTEITKVAVAGTVFYDATCRFCTGWMDRLGGVLESNGFGISPLLDGANVEEMKVIATDGRELGGADAIVFIATRIWWSRPLTWLTRFPGVMSLLRRLYRRVAARRHCGNNGCVIDNANTSARKPRLVAAMVFVIGTTAGWIFTDPGFLRMWAMAITAWIAFKLYAMPKNAGLKWWLWPGMEIRKFKTDFPTWALLRAFLGVIIIWGLARQLEPVAAGWCGMIGLLLILHFGTFEWLGWFLQVRPIMDAPWRATTLAAFWGNRWNRAFSDVTRTLLFRPLVRKFGLAVGTMTGFGFSGLLHELVISVPAGSGYGGPTAYFLIQGAAVLIERRAGFAPHRGFVWLVVLAPAFWLFHPAFMENVITPMLTTIHAY